MTTSAVVFNFEYICTVVATFFTFFFLRNVIESRESNWNDTKGLQTLTRSELKDAHHLTTFIFLQRFTLGENLVHTNCGSSDEKEQEPEASKMSQMSQTKLYTCTCILFV